MVAWNWVWALEALAMAPGTPWKTGTADQRRQIPEAFLSRILLRTPGTTTLELPAGQCFECREVGMGFASALSASELRLVLVRPS